MELGGGWNELGRGGWNWVEVGAWFSNTLAEKNYKKQAQMLYQNPSLALQSYRYLRKAEIFWNLILRNHWTWTWKISDCLTGLGLTLWYIGLGLARYLNYLAGLGFVL